jgi:hypothetical protein
MRPHRFPVWVETKLGRVRAGISAAATEEPVVVSLKLRERGWFAYRVRFDAESSVWIASVMNSKRAA